MKIECTVDELIELIKTPAIELTDVKIENDMPVHTFSNKPPKLK